MRIAAATLGTALVLLFAASPALAHGANWKPRDPWSVEEIKRRIAESDKEPLPSLEAPGSEFPGPSNPNEKDMRANGNSAHWTLWWDRNRAAVLKIRARVGATEAALKEVATSLEAVVANETLPVSLRDRAEVALAICRKTGDVPAPSSDPANIEALLKMLSEGSFAERRAAAGTLGRIGGTAETMKPEREACARALYKSYFLTPESDPLKCYSIVGLGLLGKGAPDRELVIEALRNQLREQSGSSDSLEAAVLAVALLGDRESASTLLILHTDDLLPDSVRSRAAVALAVLGRKDGRAWALERLRESDDTVTLGDAAATLALLSDTEGLGILAKRIADPKASEALLLAGVRALGEVGDARVIPPLVRVVGAEAEKSPYPDRVRVEAVAALGRLTDRRKDPGFR